MRNSQIEKYLRAGGQFSVSFYLRNTVKVDKGTEHSKESFYALINSFSQDLKGQIVLIQADNEITHGSGEEQLEVSSQIANNLEVVLHLLDSHLIESCYFKVTLISVCLSQCLYTVNQEEKETEEPEDAGQLAEPFLVELRMMKVHALKNDIDVIEEPVEEVKGSGGDVGDQGELVLTDTRYYLNALQL